MKDNTKVIIDGSKRPNIMGKIIAIILLVIVLITMLVYTVIAQVNSSKFAKEIDEFSNLNLNTVFSIDSIYLYSSADATSNEEKRAIWNLNIHQFTDIAIYINNRSSEELNYENSVKEMYIDNIRFSGLSKGEPNLYFKNIEDFAKMTNPEENLIQDRLEYKIVNDGDLDYSKAELYADCSNPLTFGYVNKNVVTNYSVSEQKNSVTFDGKILKNAGIDVDDLGCKIRFQIHIINYKNQEFICPIVLDIDLNNRKREIFKGYVLKVNNIDDNSYNFIQLN